MEKLLKKSLNSPDSTRSDIPNLKVELVTANGFKVQRVTAQPGWRWSEHQKPVVGGDSCQMRHVVYVLSGKLHTRMEDGKEIELLPGDIGVIPPGHDGWNAVSVPTVWLDLAQ